MNQNERPDPDSLLDSLTHEKEVSGRGTLKVFFGACAGVGKTYAMLTDARQRLQEDMDVVIGVVETHGRDDTAKLVEFLPKLPLKKIAYRGVEMEEFDIDAALERNPGLILIDELAHTNAPGARHPKRWQDVEELLSRGIDVYTTLNVQHLESLNDLVSRITGIQVRETVPDTIFDKATQIALIDIPTDEILKRLKEGKVYLAEIAKQRAAEYFFKKRNLIALRELALRRTAERVDAQMGVESASQGIRDVLLSGKLMVCIGHDTLSTRVVRHAKRMAGRMKIAWHAVYVETGRHYRLSEKDRLMAQRNLQLAENLGALTHVIKGDNAVDEILAYAYANGITRIMLGRCRKGWLRDTFTGTLADKLIQQSKNIEIGVITESARPPNWRLVLPAALGQPSGYIYAALMVAAATGIAWPFREAADPVNLVMFYLVGVVFVAAKFGTGASLLASLLGVSAFNFFFTEPYFTLHVSDSGYYFTFIVMLVTSFVIGSLASRLRLQASFYRQKEHEQSQMFTLAKALSATRGHENMAQLSAKQIGDVLNAVVTIWYPDEKGVLQIISGQKSEEDLREISAAKWAFENGQPAGAGTSTLPGVKGIYMPLISEDRTVGVLSIMPSGKTTLDSRDTQLIETFATLIASSLRRATIAKRAEQQRVEVEGEKLRNVLLSSVSHDLRTPLASIGGIASGLLLSGMRMSKPISEGLRSIHDQSSKLAKIVTNLLDVSSLESGKVTLNKQPYFLEEVIGSAILRLEPVLKGKEVETDIGGEQLIHIDGLLIELVFFNLLENAVRYAGMDAQIRITVKNHKQELEVTVSDNGPGIPKKDLPHVLEKFYKGPQGGLGLGLPICKAIVEVHGGRMWVQNNETGGASFIFTLPKSKNDDAEVAA